MTITWTRNRESGNYTTLPVNGDLYFIRKEGEEFVLYINGIGRCRGTLKVCQGYASDVANGKLTHEPRVPAGDSRNVPNNAQMRGLAAELAAEANGYGPERWAENWC